MSKIKWDATGERRYETGTNHGVLYRLNASGVYDKGYAWNGLTGITESPDGAEVTDLYADNIKYASMRSAENYGGTIEGYTYPDEFAECDGSAVPVEGVKLGQQPRATFGLSYRTEIGSDTVSPEGDAYIIHLVYGCTASPSDKDHETINDNPDAVTMSWDFDTTPVAVTVIPNAKPVSTIELDSTKLGAEKMAAIEAILYGTDGDSGKDARLPLPDEILQLAGYTSGT